MSDEIPLEEISELLDVKDENSLIRRKIEKYKREIQKLFQKSDELEIKIKKKKMKLKI